MWAMTVKELRQLRRDHRLLGMLVFMPLVMLVMFGYAASFDVTEVDTVVVGPRAGEVGERLPDGLRVRSVRPGEGRSDALRSLRDGDAVMAVVTGPGPEPAAVLIDGAELFAARSALQLLSRPPAAQATAGGGAAGPAFTRPEVLFNPELDTSVIMIPGLIGIILTFIGTLVTSLGVVRERQAGTLEQLAVMPFRPRDVIAGKVLPYFAIAAVDLIAVLVTGLIVFDVPFRGSYLVFALAAALFLLTTLGLGVLISTVSENQGQAVMLALMILLPQVLLSGLIFPVDAMAAGVRWIAYLLPLTYFIDIARGVLVRGTPLGALGPALGLLAVLGVAVFALSIARFRRDFAPATPRRLRGEAPAPGLSTARQ